MKNRWLMAAGTMSLIIAVIHIVAIYIGPPAYQFLDAPDFGGAFSSGSWLATIVTLGIALLFMIFSFYAFSGAGLITQKPPWLATGLWCIGCIYTVRGLAIFWFIFLSLTHAPDASTNEVVFSLISMLVGLCYLLGLKQIQRAKADGAT